MKKVLKWGLIGLGCFIGLIIIVAIVGESDSGSSGGSSSSSRSESEPALKVTPQRVYSAYQQNEARANTEYKNKDLEVTFTITGIEDKYVVQSLGDFDEAHFRLDQDELIRLNRGETLTRKCELEGFEIDTFLVFDCR